MMPLSIQANELRKTAIIDYPPLTLKKASFGPFSQANAKNILSTLWSSFLRYPILFST